jgi:hypothetical protein
LQLPSISGGSLLYLQPEDAPAMVTVDTVNRNKKKEYLKYKINELETNSNNKNIRDLFRGITEFEKGYQPRTNLEKDERGNLLADPQEILNRLKHYF